MRHVAFGLALLLAVPASGALGGADVCRAGGDALAPLQDGLRQSNVPAAWAVTTGNAAGTIAVIDSGADWLHADLAPNVWRGEPQGGRSFAEPTGLYAMLPVGADSTTLDARGHGTAVAGVAAAVCGNGIGVAGVAQVPVMIAKAHGVGAFLTVESAAAALDYAVANGARVVVMSFAFTTDRPVLRDAVAAAEGADVVLVAAVGNTNATTPRYPAAYGTVIGVGAVDATDARAGFSSRNHADVMAAGVDVPVLAPGNAYNVLTGTSLSAPLVAGVAALVLSADPSLAAADVRAILNATARDIGAPGFDADTGWGIVDAGAAVALAAGV